MKTRHRASTSMYSLTFRARVTSYNTPAVWAKWNGARSRRVVHVIAGEGIFAGMRSVRVWHACGVQWAWWITVGLCISIVLP